MPINDNAFKTAGEFIAVIEIPKGTVNNKYEYDEKSKEFKLDFVFENVTWPYNYGFFPNTLAGDGDTLDAIVLSASPIKQGREVECKVIGMIDVLDRGEEDNKVICVLLDDPLSQTLNDIADITQEQKQEWSEFLLELARQKKKITEIKAFKNKKEALKELQKSKVS
ncbi:MAG: inorganic diphosphatase [Candidatus Doudnabacteria bacterium]|nr:inorganic diphosphatase [Candidatus Doudnabacteria bacterium]